MKEFLIRSIVYGTISCLTIEAGIFIYTHFFNEFPMYLGAIIGISGAGIVKYTAE